MMVEMFDIRSCGEACSEGKVLHKTPVHEHNSK